MTGTDRTEYLPTTEQIRHVFTDEITSLGGTVSDVVDDGRHLYARAVLPATMDVRPGDAISAGVAVRAERAEIVVHPYILRQVCTNGAIATHTLGSRRLERVPFTGVLPPAYDAAVALERFREAMRASAAKEAFGAAAEAMRSAASVPANISLLHRAFARMQERSMMAHLLPRIFDRFATGGDRSAFGLMNAVTSLARDTSDASIRWRLEELGASLPALVAAPPSRRVESDATTAVDVSTASGV